MKKLNLTYNQLVTLVILLFISCGKQKPGNSREQIELKKVNRSYVSTVWVADNGDGTYSNPILHADYSDPDVVRAGDDYFMTSSSFNCSPALPVLHSKDLVNWQIINHALKRQQPEEIFDRPQHGKGVWAPSIKYHRDTFYIYWGDPDYGVYMVKTKDPFGEWEKPVKVLEGKGIIDPCPLWDDDGKAYLITAWAASRSGINSLLTIWPLNPGGTCVTGDGKHVFDGHDNHHTIEGPKLYKKDNYYYIFAPAGGVTNGWQLVLRSANIYGPYQEKIVLAQGNTKINGPHQGAWVETKSGESWFVHFQDKGVFGRILHLQPLRWVNDWPVIGIDKDGDGTGEPVLIHPKPKIEAKWAICTPAESDEFNGELGLQWQWAANYNIKWWVMKEDQDYLRLLAYPKTKKKQQLWDAPNLLLQKFPAPEFTATTKVKLTIEWDAWQGKETGLIVTGNDYSYLSFSKDVKGYQLSQKICKQANLGGKEETVDKVYLNSNEVYLQVRVEAPKAACSFFYSINGLDFKPIGKTYVAKPELWIGAKVGLFCTAEPGIRTGSYADFEWFRIEKNKNIENFNNKF